MHQQVILIDDLKAALRRRGPDSLGSKKVLLYSKTSSSVEERGIISFIDGEEAKEGDESYSQHVEKKSDCCFDAHGQTHEAELHFIGATLQLRGINPIVQPLIDTYGNILVYNGKLTSLCMGLDQRACVHHDLTYVLHIGTTGVSFDT